MRQESSRCNRGCPKIGYISAPRLGTKKHVHIVFPWNQWVFPMIQWPWRNAPWNAPVLKILKHLDMMQVFPMINPLRGRLPRSHKTKPWRSANGFGDEIGVYHGFIHGLSLSYLIKRPNKAIDRQNWHGPGPHSLGSAMSMLKGSLWHSFWFGKADRELFFPPCFAPQQLAAHIVFALCCRYSNWKYIPGTPWLPHAFFIKKSRK